ncbi:7TM diverse intracellular signaling domain-containing protein [Aquimarina sp. 2201CG1-2-11]|uniref:7TM diverse intracellular signaling domain-containing protein n=1 Tax=Aquimarina discodermiae TaxID=3231043 RepID=UPI00346380F4
MKTIYFHLSVVFFYVLLSIASFAQEISNEDIYETIFTDSITSKSILGNYFYVAEDVTLQMGIEEAVNLDYKKSEKERINLGFTNTNVWLKFKIKNNTPEHFSKLLRIQKPLLDSVSLYYKEHKKWKVYHTGVMVNEADKPIRGTSLHFPLDLTPEQTQTYYIKTYSQYGKSYAVSIINEEDYLNNEQNELLAMALIIGALVIIVFYNILLGIGLRDNVYFLYAGTILGGLLVQITVRGFMKKFLLDEMPFLQEWCTPIFLTFGTVITAQFCIHFLETKKYSRSAHWLLNGIFYYELLALAYVMIRQKFFGHPPNNSPVAMGLLLCSFLALYAGIKTYIGGNSFAKYLVIAWATYCTSVIIYTLTVFVILPENFFTLNAYMIGSILEAILLSLAVADRYNTLEKEKFNLVAQLISMEKDISLKSKEVMALQMESVKQLRSKLKIAQSLEQIVNNDTDVNVNSILADIRSSKIEDKKALIFKQKIANYNSNFVTQLSSKFPELSKTDIEIASFSKLKLTRKEIAELRGTTIHAVKSAKSRLKKKLNLSAMDSLEDFLESF